MSQRFATFAILCAAACSDGDGESGQDDLWSDLAPGQLSCQEADSFVLESSAGLIARESLRACQKDSDCTLWSPAWACSNAEVMVPNCPIGVNAASTARLDAQLEQWEAKACEKVDPTCTVGVSCPNHKTAKCMTEQCVAQ